MASEQRFEAELKPSGRGGGHLVEVPPEVVQALGGRGRTPVRAIFNGILYRGSIMRMGGVDMIGVTRAIIAEAGVEVGEILDVLVQVDDAPRGMEVPDDFARALGAAGLRRAFDAMAFSHRREYVGAIIEAKKPETRRRRIANAIKMIAARERR